MNKTAEKLKKTKQPCCHLLGIRSALTTIIYVELQKVKTIKGETKTTGKAWLVEEIAQLLQYLKPEYASQF